MPSLIDNPIAYAQFQVKGGWKNTLATTGIAATVLVGLILLTVRLSEPRTGQAWNAWVGGMLAIEAAILLLYGASRVSAAIRRDITQRMIESHQLMPVTGATAVAGYLIGAGGQALVLAGAAMLVGIGVAQQAGVAIEHFLFANLVLLLFTLFVWVASAFASFLMKGGFGLMIGVLVAMLMSGGTLAELLPPLRVLVGPVMSESIFEMKASANFIPWAYGVAVIAQALAGTLLYVGAARKYRRGEDSAFGPLLGLAMVAGWVAIGAIAVVFGDAFRSDLFRRGMDPLQQMLATLISTMLLAIVPLASAAWANVEWRRHRLEEDPRPVRRPLPIWVAAVVVTGLCAALIFTPMAAAYDSTPTNRAVFATALVVLSFCVGMGYLLRWVYLVAPGALLIGGVWLGVTWLGPLMFDFVVHSAQDGLNNVDRQSPIIGAVSPVGALLQIWGKEGDDYRVGLIAQMVINTIPVLMNLGKFRATPHANA
jgi:hypothetical protein